LHFFLFIFLTLSVFFFKGLLPMLVWEEHHDPQAEKPNTYLRNDQVLNNLQIGKDKEIHYMWLINKYLLLFTMSTGFIGRYTMNTKKKKKRLIRWHFTNIYGILMTPSSDPE
jgi:hypothetical protein